MRTQLVEERQIRRKFELYAKGAAPLPPGVRASGGSSKASAKRGKRYRKSSRKRGKKGGIKIRKINLNRL